MDVLWGAYEARTARIDALQVCDPGALATLIRIAADMSPWDDAIAHVGAGLEGFARHLDEKARDHAREAAEHGVDHCTVVRDDDARRMTVALGAELERNENAEAMRRLMSSGREARTSALRIIANAPTAALRSAVLPFSDRDRDGMAALLAIDDLPIAYDIPAEWRAWIAARASDRSSASLDDLLAVALGRRPRGAPAQPAATTWLLVRRAAAQDARARVRSTRGTAAKDLPAALELAHDPDPRLRREAIRLLAWPGGELARSLFTELATTDPDPDVRLAAAYAGFVHSP